MRYTARQRNVVWAQDAATHAALAYLEEILSGAGDGARYVFTHRLEPGQGVLCNNVLHARAAFSDAPDAAGSRMMLRARYLDRVGGTG